jgi:hypothetical protein
LPRDGESGFPVAGRIRIFLTGGWPPAILARLASEYRLLGPTGAVPLSARVDGTQLTLTPAAPLLPRTSYVIERVFAYGSDGARLDDDTRVQTPAAERRFYPDVHFVTGGDDVAPLPVVAKSLELQQAYGGGDCGPGESFRLLWHSDAPLRAGDVLAVETDDGHVVWRTPAEPGSREGVLYFGNLLCTPDPVTPGAYKMRVAAETATGKRIASEVRRAPFALFHPHRSERGSAGGNERWFAAPLGSSTPTARLLAKGYAGLAASGRTQLADRFWPWMGGDRSSFGATGMVLYGREDTRFTRIDARGQRQQIVWPHSSSGAAVFDEHGGALLGAQMWGGNQTSQLQIAFFPPGSTVAKWQRMLPSMAAYNGHPVMALAGERALVVWHAGDNTLRWAIVSLADGSFTVSQDSLSFYDTRPGVIFDGTRFVFAWSDSEHKPRLARIGLDGKLLDNEVLETAQAHDFALARVSGGSVLVAAAPSGVWMTRLDGAAQRRGPAVLISTGAPAGPYVPVVMPNGALLGVAWQAGRQKTVVVGAVDEADRVSDLLVFNRESDNPGLVATPDGWTVAYGAGDLNGWEGRAPTVEQLRCVPPGSSAPSRLR